MPNDDVREKWTETHRQALAAGRTCGLFLGRVTKVTLLTVVGLSFVAASALLISVIQFQIRIIEAKNQSKNFSLTSLIQSVAMQKEFSNSVRMVQKAETALTRYTELNENYLTQTSLIITSICTKQECADAVAGILRSPGVSQELINTSFQEFARQSERESSERLKLLADRAMRLVKQRADFQTKNGDDLSAAKAACQIINYLSSENLAPTLGFLPAYVTAARWRCLLNFALATERASGGSTPEQDKIVAQPMNSVSAAAPPLEGDLGGALFFDVVAYFRFYENMFNGLCHAFLAPFTTCGSDSDGGRTFGGDITEQIVIAPIDISFVLLVVTCGALGAMLRISAETYNPKLFDKDATEADRKTWVYYFVIGIMCSLIVYILARTVFAGLVDTTYVAKSGNMSPFVIAFMAIVSGLLCEEAFQQIIRAGKSTLVRSTGARDPGSDGGNGNNKNS